MQPPIPKHGVVFIWENTNDADPATPDYQDSGESSAPTYPGVARGRFALYISFRRRGGTRRKGAASMNPNERGMPQLLN